jgi:hypothetical protein
MNQNSKQKSVRRIVLPSGRTIEVVRLDEGSQQTTPGLHVCPECKCELVQPVSWDEVESGQWELELRCPNCYWTDDGVYGLDQVEQLEEKLDEGVEAVLADLQRLAHANMEDQVDRFIAALRAGQILPEDF